MNPQQAHTRLGIAFAAGAIILFSGCQAVADHNVKTRGDLAAGRAAAAQGKQAAGIALEAVKNLKPSRKQSQ